MERVKRTKCQIHSSFLHRPQAITLAKPRDVLTKRPIILSWTMKFSHQGEIEFRIILDYRTHDIKDITTDIDWTFGCVSRSCRVLFDRSDTDKTSNETRKFPRKSRWPWAHNKKYFVRSNNHQRSGSAERAWNIPGIYTLSRNFDSEK